MNSELKTVNHTSSTKIPVIHIDASTSARTTLYHCIPESVLHIFCSKVFLYYRRIKAMDNTLAFTITALKTIPMSAFVVLFDWMLDCVAAGRLVAFPTPQAATNTSHTSMCDLLLSSLELTTW